MRNMKFDLEDMKNNYTIFEDKFNALYDLKKGDKISFDDDKKIYIDSQGSLQFLKRWYYGENRTNSYEKLNLVFDDYNKYLIMILGSIRYRKQQEFLELADKVVYLNKKISVGLKNLKSTYTQYENYNSNLIELLDTIIECLKQFEFKYNNILLNYHY